MTPEKLQLIAAGLAGLAPDEVRKAMLLYIRNAIAEFESLKAAHTSFGQAQGCMSLIPLFWPIIGAQKRAMAAQLGLSRSRIRNAIDVWRDELSGERFVLDDDELVA